MSTTSSMVETSKPRSSSRAAARTAGAGAERVAAWSPPRRLESFLLTIVLVYTLLIGIGQLLYARWPAGLILCGVALLAAVRILRNLSRSPVAAARTEV